MLENFGKKLIVIEAKTIEEGYEKCISEIINEFCKDNAPEHCEICGKKMDIPNEELRPFGPKNSWICVPCAFETENMEKKTLQNFFILVEETKRLISKNLKIFRINECPKS